MFSRKSILFHVTLRNYQFIYTLYVTCLRYKFQRWRGRLWGKVQSSALINEIANWHLVMKIFTIFQAKFREKWVNFRIIWLWQPFIIFSRLWLILQTCSLNRSRLCHTFKVWTWRKTPLAKLFAFFLAYIYES